MQSYAGTIHLFPNVKGLGPVRFQNLRAVGAFLVSATHNGKNLTHISLHSEKGKRVRMADPWNGSAVGVFRVRDGRSISAQHSGSVFSFETDPGETYRIEPA